MDDFWKSGMWWIQRALNVIDTNVSSRVFSPMFTILTPSRTSSSRPTSRGSSPRYSRR